MFDIKKHTPIVEHALSGLGYDFTRFEVNGFVQHIAHRRQREIIIQEHALSGAIFGAWYPGETLDFIFLKPAIHPAQSIHSLIHELAHIVLGHRGFDLRDVLGKDSASAFGIQQSGGHLRAPGNFRDTEEDGEAELFAYLLQHRLLEVNRLHELYGALSSIEHLRRYLDSLDFNS